MRTWRSLTALTKVEVRNMFRNVVPLVFNLLAPVSFLVIFGLIFGKGQTNHLMPGMLTFMLLNANLTGVAHTVVTQRQNGLLRHLFSTPLTPAVWLGARVIAHLLLALVQMTLVIVTGVLLLGASLPLNLAGTAVALLFCTLAPLGLGLLLGSLFQRIESAQPVVMLSSLVLAFLGGAFLPLDAAPAIMQRVSAFVPATYMTEALTLLMVQGKGLVTAAPDLAVLAGWTVLCLTLGAWQLHRQTATP